MLAMDLGPGVFMKVMIRSIYSERVRSSIRFTQPSKVQKQFAEQCSTEHIVEKFLRGEPVATASKPAVYADLTQVPDFESLQDRLAVLNNWFNDLPSDVRSEFDNDPQKALEELTKPDRMSDAVELGLLDPSVLETDAGVSKEPVDEGNTEEVSSSEGATQDNQPQKNASQA